jgi:signal transduction histidine kinase
MDTLDHPAQSETQIDACALLRICARLALSTEHVDVAGARILLDALLRYASSMRGALVVHRVDRQSMAPTGRSPLPPSPTILAEQGVDGLATVAALAPLAAHAGPHLDISHDAWLVYDLPAVPTAEEQVTLIVAVPPAAQQDRWMAEIWGRLGEVADGIAVAVAAIRGRARERVHEAAVREEAEALKSELLGTVSHELRSPLAAIKGYAATLQRHEQRLSRAERIEFLRAIESASDRLGVVILRMLEMSQLGAGLVRMEYAPVDLGALAHAALSAAGEHARGSGTPAFTMRLLAPAGSAQALPPVRGDARWLREVFDALLENAIKYSPANGRIEVQLRFAPSAVIGEAERKGWLAREARDDPADSRPTRMLEVLVRDEGQGIPAEHLDMIFDRFHRVDRELTRSLDGLGLGLAICKRIVELHDGAIWAESMPGAGSTFHLLLPIATRA